MSFTSGFPPIANLASETLILGSFPGQASLAKNEYYAHPKNSFWPILSRLFSFDPTASYSDRVLAILKSKIAVWDVLYLCERPGSADADIILESIVPNNFQNFFKKHPNIQRVFFNGKKAELCFKKFVLNESVLPKFFYAGLPSTSPAYASISFDQKLLLWEKIKHPF